MKLSLDDYLGSKGLAYPVSDYMLDKTKIPRGLTSRQRAKFEKESRDEIEKYHHMRVAATKEYYERVAAGEIIPKTEMEKLQEIASGPKDSPRTQAAQRMIEKKKALQARKEADAIHVRPRDGIDF